MDGCCRVPGLCWAWRDVTARTSSVPMLCLPLEQNQRQRTEAGLRGVATVATACGTRGAGHPERQVGRRQTPWICPGDPWVVLERGAGWPCTGHCCSRGGRRQRFQGCQFGIPHHQQLDLKHLNNCYKSVTLF